MIRKEVVVGENQIKKPNKDFLNRHETQGRGNTKNIQVEGLNEWVCNHFKAEDNNHPTANGNEFLNGIKIFKKELQIEKINEEIERYAKMLNSVYPFISYNFIDCKLDKDYFVTNVISDVITKVYEVEGLRKYISDLYDNDIDVTNDSIILNNVKELYQNENSSLYEVIYKAKLDFGRSNTIENLIENREALINPTKELKKDKHYLNNKVNWNGTQTEFIELTKALIQNGNLKGTQKDIINTLSSLFNLKINHPSKLINDIKNTRNTGSETLFLDKLKTSLLDFINK